MSEPRKYILIRMISLFLQKLISILKQLDYEYQNSNISQQQQIEKLRMEAEWMWASIQPYVRREHRSQVNEIRFRLGELETFS